MWRLGLAEPAIKRPHRRPELEPDRFRHGKHRRGLRPQIERAVKFKVSANIAHGIAVLDRLGHVAVDRLQSFDQRHMRPWQRPARKLDLDQRPKRRKLLDTFAGQFRR